MNYPYQVYDPAGNLVLSATESCRYPKLLELSLLEAGYVILLNGEKITKSFLRKKVTVNES